MDTERESQRGCCSLFLRFLGIYWRAIASILIPLIFAPIFAIGTSSEYRCLFVVAVMSFYWVTECIPLYVTSVLPFVLFPLLDIMGTNIVAACYLNKSTALFYTGLVIAIAIEHSNLHNRIALLVIMGVGVSPRRLLLGLMAVTMFLSMWISNSAATAIMCPIITAIITELENQGLTKLYLNSGPGVNEEDLIPSRMTTCYFLAAAYSSTIGGTGTLVGTPPNLALKGLYESKFPTDPKGIEFVGWMFYCIPPMLIMTIVAWVILIINYMGLFRPQSKDAEAVNLAIQGKDVVKAVIKNKFDEMGSLTWHEFCVGCLFLLTIVLWVFRKPEFIPGWGKLVTKMEINSSCVGIMTCFLLFLIPKDLEFRHAFSKNPERRPKKAREGLLNWPVIHQKMPWGLMLLLGAGFALAKASDHSGMSRLLAHQMKGLSKLPKYALMFLCSIFASAFTEFAANTAIANIMLPVLAEMALTLRIHPQYLMVPVTVQCSFSFMLPVGTPPNAIIIEAGHVAIKDMAFTGLFMSLACLIIPNVMWPWYGQIFFPSNTFPDWAEEYID